MRTRCIACDEDYYYRDEDEDCSKFLCSFCHNDDYTNMAGKWARLRFRILARDEFTCRYCGDSPLKNKQCNLHIDHKTPVSRGGTNSELNLITSCSMCNFGKLSMQIKRVAEEKIDEYLKQSEEQLGKYNPKAQAHGIFKMEDLKAIRSNVANGKHVAQRSIQSNKATSKRVKKALKCETQLVWSFFRRV